MDNLISSSVRIVTSAPSNLPQGVVRTPTMNVSQPSSKINNPNININMDTHHNLSQQTDAKRTLQWQLNELNQLKRELRANTGAEEVIVVQESCPVKTGINILDEALKEISESNMEDGPSPDKLMRMTSSTDNLHTRVSTQRMSNVSSIVSPAPRMPSPLVRTVAAVSGPNTRLPIAPGQPLVRLGPIRPTIPIAVSKAGPQVVQTSPRIQVSTSPHTPIASSTPQMNQPLLVTGVVLPAGATNQQLISFVDASGHMQLATVTTPTVLPVSSTTVINPPGQAPARVTTPSMSNPVRSTASPQPKVNVVTKCVAPLPPFRSSIRTIVPSKQAIKGIKGIQTYKTIQDLHPVQPGTCSDYAAAAAKALLISSPQMATGVNMMQTTPVKTVTSTSYVAPIAPKPIIPVVKDLAPRASTSVAPTTFSIASPSKPLTTITTLSSVASTMIYPRPVGTLTSTAKPPIVPREPVLNPATVGSTLAAAVTTVPCLKSLPMTNSIVSLPVIPTNPIVVTSTGTTIINRFATTKPTTFASPVPTSSSSVAPGVSLQPREEDKSAAVKNKILSVSTPHGVSKAGELSKANLFKLVQSESNVVITARSTAVQDILDQLKKQFPDKKFIINYNTSKTAGNLKNFVQTKNGPTSGPAVATSNGDKKIIRKKALDHTKGSPKMDSKTSSEYRSARLRGEKAPPFIAQERVNRKPIVSGRSVAGRGRGKLSQRGGRGGTRGRGRKPVTGTDPLEIIKHEEEDEESMERAVADSIHHIMNEVEVKVDPLPSELAMCDGPIKVNQINDLLGIPGSSDDTSCSSAAVTNDYNAEIRIGEEYQAEIPDYMGLRLEDDFKEHSQLIFHPENGLLDTTTSEGPADCVAMFPLYDFVEWTADEKRLFKKYLSAYKTKFFKYLTVLPGKKIKDIIDHYYSTRSPARDHVLPKKINKHYYLVSRSKPAVPSKSVFGVINDGSKRRVIPNKRLCSNPNIVLYENSIPANKQIKDAKQGRRKRGRGRSPTKGGGLGRPRIDRFITEQHEGEVSVLKQEENDAAVEGKPNEGENDDSNEHNSSEIPVLLIAGSTPLVKERPKGDHEDVKDLFVADTKHEFATIDDDLESLKTQVMNLRSSAGRNKSEMMSVDVEMKKMTKMVEGIKEAIGKARRVSDMWTEEDRLLTIHAFRTFGKDFKAVSRLVGTKSEQAIKAFYDTNSQRYGLDTPTSVAEEQSAPTVAVVPSPLKERAESPAKARPLPSILRRKPIPMKSLK